MATEVGITFFFLIVLYKTRPSASRTIVSLLASAKPELVDRLVVLDHSPADQRAECEAVCSMFADRFVYQHDPANPPLGLAYNRAIRTHLRGSNYVVVADQDTDLPTDFLACAAEVAARHGEPGSMAANIISNDRIASPCWSLFGWGRSWRRPHQGWHSWRYCSAITSASCIHRRIFQDLGVHYNEELVLYGIDTDFFRRLSKVEPRFYILPMSVAHSLSFDEASNAEKMRKLDQIFSANRLIYSKAGWPSRWAVKLIESLLRIKYSIRFRNSTFLLDPARRRHD